MKKFFTLKLLFFSLTFMLLGTITYAQNDVITDVLTTIENTKDITKNTQEAVTGFERVLDKYSAEAGNLIKGGYEELKELAVKLQVPLEHIYKVLIRQAYIKSITYLLILLLSFLLFYYSINIYTKKRILEKNEGGDKGLSVAWRDFSTTEQILSLLLMFGSTICFGIGAGHLEIIVQGIVNPEYIALETIIETLKQFNNK